MTDRHAVRPCGHPEDLCKSPGCCADCGQSLVWSGRGYDHEGSVAKDNTELANEIGEARGFLRRRLDGRFDVADEAMSDAIFGCLSDDWCILAVDHDGDCSEDREEWVGPNALYTPKVSEGVR